MKEHPDRQPRRAKTVNGGNDDDRNANDQFESERIDLGTSVLTND
jgi:hypothetical protein